MIAFSQPCLDTQSIVSFVNELALEVLVTGHNTASILPTVISSTSTVRVTGIFHFTSTDKADVKVASYQWDDPISRPGGKRLPVQCAECRHYFSWKVPRKHSAKAKEVVFECRTKDCSGVYVPLPLRGYKKISKVRAKLYRALV